MLPCRCCPHCVPASVLAMLLVLLAPPRAAGVLLSAAAVLLPAVAVLHSTHEVGKHAGDTKGFFEDNIIRLSYQFDGIHTDSEEGHYRAPIGVLYHR